MAYKMTKYSDHVTDFDRDGTRTVEVNDGYLYSVGGWTSARSWNDIYRSKDLKTWEKVGVMPMSIHTFGLEKLSDRILIYGGDYNNPAMECWLTYDFKSFYHQNTIPFPQRILYGSCSNGVYAYLAGGMSSISVYTSSAREVLRTVDGIVWEKMSDGFPAIGRCMSGSMCFFNGKLWFITGGAYDYSVHPRETYYSEDFGKNWQRGNDVPFAGRYYNDTKVWDGKLWSICGSNRDLGGNLKDIWYMDSTGVWTEFIPPVEFLPRHATGVSVFKNKLVITNGNLHNDCWAIENS